MFCSSRDLSVSHAAGRKLLSVSCCHGFCLLCCREVTSECGALNYVYCATWGFLCLSFCPRLCSPCFRGTLSMSYFSGLCSPCFWGTPECVFLFYISFSVARELLSVSCCPGLCSPCFWGTPEWVLLLCIVFTMLLGNSWVCSSCS
jgi:hypothetical protein